MVLVIKIQKINDVKWTYNVGTTLSAAAHLYFITKDDKWKQISEDLAKLVLIVSVLIEILIIQNVIGVIVLISFNY